MITLLALPSAPTDESLGGLLAMDVDEVKMIDEGIDEDVEDIIEELELPYLPSRVLSF